MARSDDIFPPDDRCEICGGVLEDEIVIQEFADGSLARLCIECAAGANLGTDAGSDSDEPPSGSASEPAADTDPLEMTKELLTPVVDLIDLQREMQSALERLAASLERFASGVLIENLDKAAIVEDRVQALERELEQTRARLRQTEAMLTAAAAPSPALLGETAETASAPTTAADSPVAVEKAMATETMTGETTAGETIPVPAADLSANPPAFSETPDQAWAALTAPTGGAAAPPAMPTPAAPVAPPAAAPVAGPDGEAAEQHGFRIEEVQAVQRYFNDSPFTGKTRDVRQSLGKPRVNLTRAAGPEPRAFVTVAWDIVWYQYLVDMRRDIPSDERVVLHREGMDLDELADQFMDKNATVNDDGRLDASELEVRLLSDPSALITEMTPDEERALEDATEEIWDQRIAPEFKWDD